MAGETPAERRARLEAVRATPAAQTWLDLIATTEGVKHGYNTAFGNAFIESLADHPRTLHDFTETTGRPNKTSAAGRYQFRAQTWDEAARAVGARDFGALNQDLAALYLMERRGALDDVLAGRHAEAQRKLAPEWASLPGSPYPQPTKQQQFVDDFIAQHATSVAAPTPPPAVPPTAVPLVPYAPLRVRATAPLPEVVPFDVAAGTLAPSPPSPGGMSLAEVLRYADYQPSYRLSTGRGSQ